MKKYNVGVKVHRVNGALHTLVLMQDWLETAADAERVLINSRNDMAMRTVSDIRGIMGYAIADSSTRVFVGPEAVSNSVVEISMVERDE